MSTTVEAPDQRLRIALAARPDGVVETIAKDAGLTPRDVLEALGPGEVAFLPADSFESIWADLAGWEEVLLIVHTEDIVLEVNGPLPSGSHGHGWFNIHGDSPIGGHIRRDRCAAVAIVDRQFHGRRSCSVWFLNGDGHAMFKVFVPRDETRALKPALLTRFDALRAAHA
ncbi:heme utilization cystosolic carrier protein HutX [Chthonobacter albigriseus]|uniref:heme utilization cystosolic carrier protein HutX n=1 Tax=Chthonobacter albigriseus TaxID=1683161 RepID=UPI0015EE9BDE|nr:heme utilization cystosolic carrier protein HutX [Chthonobacter albigriseus]